MTKLCDECGASITVDHTKENFCSDGCREVYERRKKDKLLSDPEFNERLDDAYKRGVEDGSAVHHDALEIKYEEGFMDGLIQSLKMAKVCPSCQDKEIESLHHIVPRAFGGGDNIENLVFLCRACHDRVETSTHWLFLHGRNPPVNTLRTYIEAGFPDFHD
jgi:5-methylcytosine-specific restriction endonuclease McrA